MSFEFSRHPLGPDGQALPYPDTGQRPFAAFGDIPMPIQSVKETNVVGETPVRADWNDPDKAPYLAHERKRFNAADYLAECRVSFVTAQLSENASLGTDDDGVVIRRLVNEFCAVYDTQLTELAGLRTSRRSVEDFLSNNLRGIAILPRLLLLRSHNPAVWSSEEEAPTKTPLPDFFSLSIDEQRSVVGLVGEELLELCRIMRNYDPNLIKIFKNLAARSRPLAILSVNNLNEALVNYSSLRPVEICRMFVREPTKFASNLEKASAAAQSMSEAIQPEPIQDDPPIHNSVRLDTGALCDTPVGLAGNKRAILSLLHGTRANRQALTLTPGDTIRLTEANKPISAVDFDLLIDTHLQIIGRRIYDDVANENTKGVIMPNWHDTNLGAVLRGDFYGKLQNLIVSRLSVDEESLATFKEHFRPGAPSADHFADLLFGTELKSGGKKPRMVLLRTLVIVETSNTPYDTIRKHEQVKCTTSTTIRGMHRAVKTIAALADTAAINNVLRG